jgi:hypothetical protein
MQGAVNMMAKKLIIRLTGEFFIILVGIASVHSTPVTYDSETPCCCYPGLPRINPFASHITFMLIHPPDSYRSYNKNYAM